MKIFGKTVYKTKVLLFLLGCVKKIKKNQIALLAFRDTVSGNTKAMYHYIKDNYTQYEVKWGFEDDNKIPAEIKENGDYFLLSEIAGLKYFASSRYIFTDTSFVANLYKNKRQICIQMWHGDRGFKKVQYGAFPDKRFYDEVYCDYAVCGSAYGERKFIDFFKMSEKQLLKFGCPRNDLLIANNISKSVHRYYGIPDDAVIVLYAPTLREKNRNLKTQVPFDYTNIIKTAKEKYKTDVYFLVRAHKANLGMEQIDDPFYIDVSEYPDMEDILEECQVLITDYSSSAGDFILTGKQVILYIPQEDDYTKKDRSLVFNINESPYMIAKNDEDIARFILLSNDEIKKNDKAIMDFYGCYEDGTARQKIMNFIEDFQDERTTA